MIKSESTTDYSLTRGFTENGARNAELNSIKPSPSKVVPVDEVLQGQLVEGIDHGVDLVEGIDHGVDLLPLGARGLVPLLGGGLVQHALRGGGLHGDLRLHAALDPLAALAGLVVRDFLLFVHLRFVTIHHGHGEPSEILAVRVPIARG